MNARVEAEAAPLPPDAKALAQMAEQLTQSLRLRTFPIGMKLFEEHRGDGRRCRGCGGRRRARRSPPASS